MSGQPPLPMVGEVLNPAPTPSAGPHGQPAGAGSGLVAIRAYDGLTASDNALLEVLRDLERDRGTAADASRSVVRALAARSRRATATPPTTPTPSRRSRSPSVLRLGLDRDALAELAAVALLHDVGKIGIPDAILHKPGPLDDDEWARDAHASGDRRAHPFLRTRAREVARAVRHEHERWDGNGYPDGLAGEDDPARLAHRARLRRLARDRQRPPVPRRARARGRRSPSCAAAPGPSSTPPSSTPCSTAVSSPARRDVSRPGRRRRAGDASRRASSASCSRCCRSPPRSPPRTGSTTSSRSPPRRRAARSRPRRCRSSAGSRRRGSSAR